MPLTPATRLGLYEIIARFEREATTVAGNLSFSNAVRLIPRLAVPVLLIASLSASPARGQWRLNGEGLCTAASYQFQPQMASDGAGGAIVTWQDSRGGGGIGDIYAQRINALGVPQWATDGVVLCTFAGDQINPRIVKDGAGGAIVAWQDYRSNSNYDIYAQRVSATGAPQWTQDGVALCTSAGNQTDPMIISDGSGGAIAAWQDHRSGVSDGLARRINAAGGPQSTALGVAHCTAPGGRVNPTIVADGVGGAIVSWADSRTAPWDIYAQRLSSAGTLQWSAAGAAVCTATDYQVHPAITSDGAGGAIVTW